MFLFRVYFFFLGKLFNVAYFELKEMKIAYIVLLVGVTQIQTIRSWEYCTNNGEYGGYIRCETNCCGSWPYEECCDFAWLGWAIAGGVIGCILLIGFIICVVCVCVKKKGKSGRVIQPQSATTGSYIPNNTQGQAFQTQYVTIGFTQPSAPSLPSQYPPASALPQTYSSTSDPPPTYQSLYGQQQQQHPPPLPFALTERQQQQQQQQQQQTLLPIGL